jgi:hypothetical protein
LGPLALLRNALEQEVPDVAEKLEQPPLDRKIRDFSFQNPDKAKIKSLPTPDSGIFRLRKYLVPRLQADEPFQTNITSKMPSKASITARIIQSRQVSFDHPPVLYKREKEFLTRHGYTAGDVAIWALIITQRDLSKGIDILQWASSTRSTPDTPVVPLFIISFLLKRRDMTSQSLQRLLTHTWTLLRQGTSPNSFRDRQIFVLFTRFHRHARKVWPQGLVNIASLLTTFLPWGHIPGQELTPAAQTRVALMFNTALNMLSQASRIRPFLCYVYAEKAQFHLLGRMTQFPQVLNITADGYKALVKVQLANRKTIQEREWSRLQSRAWPPVPEPKNQFDEDKGFEFGASRAMRTIQHMRFAGYSSPEWERVAQLYAGWESDGSPTIQTRKIIRPIPEISEEPEAALWSARIDVARDIREAWARFLQYEATNQKPNRWIYFAIFRKIAMEQRRLDSQKPLTEDILPGDSRNLYPPASSPMQKLYLLREPDSYMELFRRMINDGIYPKGQFLGFLISSAPGIEDGIEIWKKSSKADSMEALIPSACKISGSIPMDEPTFAGLTELLCRFPFHDGLMNLLDTEKHVQRLQQEFNQISEAPKLDFVQGNVYEKAFFQAFWLTKERKSVDFRAWKSILSGAVEANRQPKVKPFAYLLFGYVYHILTTMSTLRMPSEVFLFEPICQYMELAARSARYEMAQSANKLDLGQGSSKKASYVLASGTRILRSVFATLTSSAVPSEQLEKAVDGLQVPPIPATLSTINITDCLRYIRALAAFSDHEGIYSFAKWLVAHESEMKTVMEQQAGGLRRYHFMLTAIRLGLEKPKVLFSDRYTESFIPSASEELIELVKKELMTMQHLPGWATNEDLKAYQDDSDRFERYELFTHQRQKPDSEISFRSVDLHI